MVGIRVSAGTGGGGLGIEWGGAVWGRGTRGLTVSRLIIRLGVGSRYPIHTFIRGVSLGWGGGADGTFDVFGVDVCLEMGAGGAAISMHKR